MTDETIAVPCPSCGAWEPQAYIHGYDRLLGHPGSFTICACKRCGLLYLNPRPRNLMRYYEGAYLPFQQHVHGGILASLQRVLPRRPTRRARMLSHLAGKPGTVLDIGCAGGDFVAEMAQASWKVAGVEPNASAAGIASKRFPDRIIHGTLQTAGYPDRAFDLVTMWDVVEHLPDPRSTLEEIERILKPGGLLFIQTPRSNSIDARLFGAAWVGWECPRHVCVFSSVTLCRMLAQLGYTSEEIPQLVSSHWIWALSCRFWIQERFGVATGERIYHLLTRRPLRWLLKPFFETLDRIGVGSLLTVIARPMH